MYPIGTDDHHQGKTQVQRQGGNGIGHRGDESCFHIHSCQIVIDLAEPVLFKLGFAQRLDNPDAGDIFLDGADYPIQHSLLLGVQGNAGFGDEVYHDADDGQQTDQNQREHRIHGQHHAHTANEQDGRPDAQTLKSGQQLIDIIGVTGEPGFGGGDGQLVHLTGGQTLKLLEQVMANGTGDLAGALGAHPVGHDIAGKTAGGAQQHQSAIEPDGPDIACGYFFIQHHFHQAGNQKLQHRAEKLDPQSEGNEAPVGEYVFFQSDQNVASFCRSCICNYFSEFSVKCKGKNPYFPIGIPAGFSEKGKW